MRSSGGTAPGGRTVRKGLPGGGDAPARIGQVLNHLGQTLLQVVAGRVDPDREIHSVAMYHPLDPPDLDPGALVLGLGIADGATICHALREVSAAGAVGLVLREPVAVDEQVELAAAETGVAILGLVRGASWTHLAAVLTSTLRLDHRLAESIEGTGDAETDLFDLANSLASMLEAPITIENMSSRILAFSADQAEADDARKQGILGHQVPQEYTDQLRRSGFFQVLYASAVPVFMPPLGPDHRARTGMRIRAGEEILGSIWAVVDRPLSPHQTQGFIEAANVVALHMLRSRITHDAATRLRSSLVRTLLDGGRDAQEAADRLGIRHGGACVLATSLTRGSDDAPRTEAELQRLDGMLSMFLQSSRPSAATALIGSTVYTVLPLSRAPGAAAVARTLGTEFMGRMQRPGHVRMGIGDPVLQISGLARSRRTADMALRVLLSAGAEETDPAGEPRLVASASDVQIDSLLLRMSDILEADDEGLTGPLARLAEHDLAHDSELTATLSAWLDSFGDAARAAAGLHIHVNTFRYRLRKLTTVCAIDLDDPDVRFGLMLQLRLFAPPR